MVPQADRLPEDRHLSRRGSVAAALVFAAAFALIGAPLFALAAKALCADVLSAEARTIAEASATAAFPSLSLARLGEGIEESDLEAFRTEFAAQVLANAAGGPLDGCVIATDAALVDEGTVECTVAYRPGDLGRGAFGAAVPAAARATCRVDLAVEP